ncbi:hypothetical protein JTE90_013028 [Oedothorax gibbosus]|uniref:Anti-proliferative protein domain-containing protein n=1 Tax=Oedothorax gibbosus TaxID=931172 RepID=A0AAV6U9T7_9ARAC|nr:hypothetical protein JTE90_013028 [Oedothorax gibbosus]
MKEEILAAVNFLTRLVGKNEDLSSDQVEVFQNSLGTILMEKFDGHWFPEKPCKGQAYRCIRVNGNERRDPVLEQAAEMCGLEYENLKLPVELTVWVDPLEVCCRFGEDEGSYCTVASFKDNKENISDNVIDDHLKSSVSSHQNSQESQKKPAKKPRKPLEKQKKPPTRTSQPNLPPPPKPHFPPKTPFFHMKDPGYLNTCFDWSPPGEFPFHPRFNNHRNYPDLAFMRRPNKKPVRSMYPTDRYHWARK